MSAAHDQAGGQREDDVAYALAPDNSGVIVAAVADGVGSSRLSHLASTLAAERAVQLTAAAIEDLSTDGDDWATHAEMLVRKLSRELDEPALVQHIHDLGMPPPNEETLHRSSRPATTLALIMARPESQGAMICWLCVGDCEVGTLSATSQSVRWKTPRDERDGQKVRALPSTHPKHLAGTFRIAADEHAVAMTDGMVDIAQPAHEFLQAACNAAMRDQSALSDLLTSLDLRVQGALDDRSVVAIGLRAKG